MPLLVPAAALGAGALADLAGRRVQRIGIALLVCGAMLETATLAIRSGREVGPVLTGSQPRDAYLESRVQSYASIAAANRMLPPRARLLLIWENRGYYLERSYLADSFFEASTVMDLARECGSPEAMAARVRALGVTHVLFNDVLGRYFLPRYGDGEREILAGFCRRYLAPVGAAAGVGLFEFRADGVR
jgi:hypothetical protein